jgi:hypothetical protein
VSRAPSTATQLLLLLLLLLLLPDDGAGVTDGPAEAATE